MIRRVLLIAGVVVLALVGVAVYAHQSDRRMSDRVSAARSELNGAWDARVVDGARLAWHELRIAPHTGKPVMPAQLFPTIEGADFLRASMGHHEALSAVYVVDAGFAGSDCVTVTATGNPPRIKTIPALCS